MRRLFILILFIPRLLFGQINSEEPGIWGANATDTDYNDSADVLFTYWTDESTALKVATSQFYDSIQAYHIDDSLDFLFNFAVNTTGNAVYDWIRLGTTATLVNSPTFTAYQGYTTDGASSYVKANYNPGTDADNWLLNSASIGCYIRTDDNTENTYIIGIYDGTNIAGIRIRNPFRNYINSTNYYATGTLIQGFTIVTRSDASTLKFAQNGDDYSSSSQNTNAIVNQANGIYLGALNNNGSADSYSGNQISFAFGGGQLTETQKTKLYEAMERYMDFFGYGVND